jgi:hypothetical protein
MAWFYFFVASSYARLLKIGSLSRTRLQRILFYKKPKNKTIVVSAGGDIWIIKHPYPLAVGSYAYG